MSINEKNLRIRSIRNQINHTRQNISTNYYYHNLFMSTNKIKYFNDTKIDKLHYY